MTAGFEVRPAAPGDEGEILSLISALAECEKLGPEAVATEELIREALFEKKSAEAALLRFEGKTAGFALWFFNFSTFLGRAGLYLEDLFILPEYRGRGLGRETMRYLSALALERGCGRFEWSCLDGNEPAIGFYKNLGAVPMSDWTVWRLTGDKLKEAAGCTH